MKNTDEHFPHKIRSLPPFQSRFDAFELKAMGCQVLFASYPAGKEIEPHSHDSHNCCVVTQGELFLTLDGEEKAYSVGEWFEVPSGKIHSARTEESTSIIEFWFEG